MASWLAHAVDSGSSGQCSSPGRGHYVVFLGKTLYFQVYKWVPATHNGGSNPTIAGLESHPGRTKTTPSRFMLQKP